MRLECLILGDAGVYLIAPGEDAALHVADVLEAGGLEDSAGAGAAHTALAVDDDVGGFVEFVQPLPDGSEGYEDGAGDVADLVLVGFAHIDEQKEKCVQGR